MMSHLQFSLFLLGFTASAWAQHCYHGNEEAFRSRWHLLGPVEDVWKSDGVDLDLPANESLPLIVGGKRARFNQQPGMVSLQFRTNGEVTNFCGGTLVAKNKVVTAAYCFYLIMTKLKFRLEDLRVGLGYYRISEGHRNKNVQIIKIASVDVHPDFSPCKERPADLAVLTLSHDATIVPSVVETVPLSDLPPSRLHNRKCSFFGWGTWKPPGVLKLSNVLKYAKFTVLSEKECSPIWKCGYSPRFQVCAKGYKAAACKFDYGGPLVDTATRQLIGVFSVENERCSRYLPSVFTSIGYFYGWLQQQLYL